MFKWFEFLADKTPPDRAEDVYRRLASKGISARPEVFAIPETSDFVFGPELHVSGLIADGTKIEFAERSPNFIDLAFGEPIGSCPHLLSWDEQSHDWVERGKVLRKANEQGQKSRESISLPGLVKRFRLAEREPEVTILDRAELFLTLSDGRQVAARPINSDGRDHWPSLVFWGETRQLVFGLPPGVSAKDVTQSRLVLTGYYERYSNLPDFTQ